MGERYDVVVVGGGVAGTVAAVQAGRAGARTLLVERAGMLGGTVTSAGVAAPQSFCAYGTPVIAGIGWEWVQRAKAAAGEPLPDLTHEYGPSGVSTVPVNVATFAATADALVLEAGVELLLHAMPAEVAAREDGWNVTLCTKTGLRAVEASVVIDATGDANVVALAGLAMAVPEERQPATLVFRLDGYDPEGLDYPALEAAFTAAVAAGEVRASDAGWHQGRIAPLLRWRGGNCAQVVDVDGTTSEARTAAEVEARRMLLRLLGFLRRQPGLERLRVAWVAPEVGIRESVTIVGEATITGEDYVSGRQWADAVCFSFYPVDIHLPEGLDYQALTRGTVPTIPFGALLPRGSRRLLAAGRCIAGDRRAFSAYRVQATCMATGQAAGAAAALAAARGCDVRAVPLDALRGLLTAHGAIVPSGE